MRTRRPFLLIALGATALIFGSLTLPAEAHPANVASPGSRGIGDLYFPLDGNGGYDVSHYTILDDYNFGLQTLRGTTTVQATATQDLSRFDLDLVLQADAVSVNGEEAQFHSGAHELVITPAHAIPDGDSFTVTVRYHGKPGDVEFGGERPFYSTSDEAMATNEPHIAAWWFAANDHPTDKATYDITIRVPVGHQVVSNGSLVSHRVRNGLTSWHWRETKPMASYLAFFVAGSFELRSGKEAGIPYTSAVSTLLGRAQQNASWLIVDRTPRIVSWEASQFGPYPFESTGGVVVALNRGFSLENQTRPTYPYFGYSRGVVSLFVHELGHQWFGDDVSVHRWADIWLNEGFASYAQWLWAETHGGYSGDHKLHHLYNVIPKNSPFWQLEVADPGPNDLFDGPIYARGAMTLQALRNRIGADDLSTVLHDWVREHGGGNGSTDGFMALATKVSGQDLDGFFQHWLYDTKKPANTAENGL